MDAATGRSPKTEGEETVYDGTQVDEATQALVVEEPSSPPVKPLATAIDSARRQDSVTLPAMLLLPPA